MNYLKNKILDHINNFNSSIAEFERRINVSNASLTKFINGNVKSPSLETAIKIADMLNCSLDELVGRQLNSISDDTESKYIQFNQELLRSICNYTFYFIESKVINHDIKVLDINYVKIIYAVDEIYKFCLNKNQTIVDTRFADMFLTNILEIPFSELK